MIEETQNYIESLLTFGKVYSILFDEHSIYSELGD
jgi:hypothetical protein